MQNTKKQVAFGETGKNKFRWFDTLDLPIDKVGKWWYITHAITR